VKLDRDSKLDIVLVRLDSDMCRTASWRILAKLTDYVDSIRRRARREMEPDSLMMSLQSQVLQTLVLTGSLSGECPASDPPNPIPFGQTNHSPN
jgi:hypothetical protein